MNLCVTILANQDALVKFFLDLLPVPSVSFGSNAKVFTTEVVKYKRIHTGMIAAEDVLSPFVGYCSLFDFLPAPGDIVLVLATLAAELALSP